MAWRVAKAIFKFRDQLNAAYPKRNKASDGYIGDAAHASRSSDHNPWVKDGKMGVVTAGDWTHDPKNGLDTWALAETLRQKRDPRIKYVISNRRIFSSATSPWTWRKYTGSNPHSSHMHVSVHSSKSHYDNDKAWDIGVKGSTPPAPAPTPPPLSPGDTEDVKTRPVIRRGSKGEAVREVQSILSIKVDGDFGPQTDGAVRAFQGDQDLKVDGIVGPNTWIALDKIEQHNDGEAEGDALEDTTDAA